VSRTPGVHRASPVRPRYGRLAVLGSAVAVTAIAVLGSVGVLPTSGEPKAADQGAAAISGPDVEQPDQQPHQQQPSATATTEPPAGAGVSASAGPDETAEVAEDALPADSGTGKRIVFSEDRQRVWLVDGEEQVARSYLVSGSVMDNLDPGSYQVYSKSRWAVGIDDSGVMEYFARFTKGPNGAAIGFHTIPSKNGTPLQTADQLGTPQSHGCIRQLEADALALWEFAPVGTTVVVTA
jgi:hypothetical protein